ncbi:MAG: FAD-dependent oxidoreductase [Thermoguttaceae bacterium]|nr:FAD-dependent oxidoreductase [Thermoguttaceae bacterium]
MGTINDTRQAGLSRRKFMATATAAAGVFGARPLSAAGMSDTDTIPAPSRDVPIVRRVDVLVCGGGPAGVGAALFAARTGAKTMLLESMPFLGGVWTAVGVSHLMAGRGRSGVNAEIHSRLPVHQVFGRNIYLIEDMKILLDDLMAEAGVEVQVHTRAVAAAKDGSRLRGVFTESKSGLEFIEAKMVVDATGDGDVAAAAGCEYEMGRPFDGRTQPVTLFGTIGGYQGEPAKGAALVEILKRGGWQPSYPPVTLFPQPGQPGVFVLMATQFYGVDATNVRDLSRAEMLGRQEIRKCVEVFKEHGGDAWKDVFLIKTGPAIGVRETRRIRGHYYLTWEDLDRGAQFEDGVVDVTAGSNIHSVDDPYGDGPPKGMIAPPKFRVRPYQIPLRCLIARDADNLLTAGRCISGDHYALGSYRLTGSVAQTGEAAGMAAALAVKENVVPQALDGKSLVEQLDAMRGDKPA